MTIVKNSIQSERLIDRIDRPLIIFFSDGLRHRMGGIGLAWSNRSAIRS